MPTTRGRPPRPPEAHAGRPERRQRRLFPAEGESARAKYAHWLNDFIAGRQPAPPYQLGRQYVRRFLAQVCSAYHAQLAAY